MTVRRLKFFHRLHIAFGYLNTVAGPTILVLAGIFMLAGCDDVKQEKQKPPQLVILGEDLSGTFTGYTPIGETDLRDLCTAVAKKGGGTVYFIGIGSSTPRGVTSCRLKKLPAVDPNDPVGVKRDKERKRQVLRKQNDAAIEAFVTAALEQMGGRREPFTDINGFLEKASALADDLGHEGYEKWLFINSDGKQETRQSKTVDCGLKAASFDRFFLSSSWKKQPDCSPEGRFLTPRQFVDYFRNQ